MMLLFEWLLRAALLAALIGVGAWALDEALRGVGRATRFVWLAALLLSIVLPVAALLAPDLWPEPLKRPGVVMAWPDVADALSMVNTVNQVTSSSALAGPSAQQWSARSIVLSLWLAASIVLGLRWLYGWYKLRRARMRWREAILSDQRVLVSDDLGPAVVGLVRPRVVIPSWLVVGDAAQQRMIVRHEVEHLRAGDQWLLAFAPVLVALFPWNPALWWQLQRLRIAIELDCDARVLRAGESALEYGSMLLDVAGSTKVLQPTLATLSEPRTSLERRIRAMTPTRYRHALTRAASLLALSALTLLGAVAAVAPTAQPVVAQRAQQRPAVAVQQQEGSPLVVVDGRVIASSRFDFSNLQLQSVEVLKPAEAQRKFGQRARYGAVVISTRTPDISVTEIVATPDRTHVTAEAITATTVAAGPARARMTAEAIGAAVAAEPIRARGTIAGQVIRSETGEAVAGAYVSVGNVNAVTDSRGRYVIRNVTAGEQKLMVRSKDSFGVEAVTVVANAVTPMEAVRLVAMSEEEFAKIDLAVRAERQAVEAIHATTTVAPRVATTVAPEPVIVIDGVQVSPAVKADGLGAGASGGTSPRTSSVSPAQNSIARDARLRVSETAPNPLIIVNGVVIGSGEEALKIIRAIIDPDMIDHVEVVKGDAARRLYGEQARDGVITITTKRR